MSPGRSLLLLASALPLWPFLNLIARRAIITTFPRVFVSFGTFALAYLAGLLVVTVWTPWMLPLTAIAGVAFTMALWWRSRVSYGTDRGLPPGSLAILRPEPWTEHWHYLELTRTYGSIFKVSHFFTPMVCVTNLASGLRLLKTHDDVRLRSPKVAADRFLPCGFMRGMDPEHHKVYRKVLQSIMTPRVVATWEPLIEAEVSAALTELARTSNGVYSKPAWDRLLRRSFARLFFGIEPDTPAFRQLEDALATIGRVAERRVTVAWLPSERRTRRVLDEVAALLRQQTAPDCFLAELRRQPEFGDSTQVLLLLLFAMHLGAADMAGLLQWVMKMACDFPAAFDRLRESLARDDADAPAAVRRFTLETLRRHQVEHLYRRVLEDIEWDGFRIPKGWLLRICLAEAHRDPAFFADPEQYEPNRLVDMPSQDEFLPFGAFRRSCLGDAVVHAFTGQFLRVLSTTWTVRQVGTSHEQYQAWHWTPGGDFRIALAMRPSI